MVIYEGIIDSFINICAVMNHYMTACVCKLRSTNAIDNLCAPNNNFNLISPSLNKYLTNIYSKSIKYFPFFCDILARV